MMNCPSCGALMVWLNGSVLHDPPTKYYHCRVCGADVVKYADGTYDLTSAEQVEGSQTQE